MSTDKKERIIEAATTSFGEYGFRGTTMDQVAKIAKVGKGTVYKHFDTKEQLFDEIVDLALEHMIVAANNALHDDLPFCENIRYVLDAILSFRQNHALIIKIVQEARDIQTFHVIETVEKIDQKIIGYLQNLIEQQIEKGETFQQNPEFLAFLLFKIYILLISEWEKKHAPLTSEQILEILQRQVY